MAWSFQADCYYTEFASFISSILTVWINSPKDKTQDQKKGCSRMPSITLTCEPPGANGLWWDWGTVPLQVMLVFSNLDLRKLRWPYNRWAASFSVVLRNNEIFVQVFFPDYSRALTDRNYIHLRENQVKLISNLKTLEEKMKLTIVRVLVIGLQYIKWWWQIR